jgi:hypothetical protein
MYVVLVQYPHLVSCAAIPSIVVPYFAPQEVPLQIQEKHGDVMEDSEWAHKGSRWCCKVDACISSYVTKWLFHQHLEQTHSFQMQVGKSRCPSIHPRGPRQQDHGSLNAHILSNPHARQKENEKKAFDQVKKNKK